jgi:hypothetical protein
MTRPKKSKQFHQQQYPETTITRNNTDGIGYIYGNTRHVSFSCLITVREFSPGERLKKRLLAGPITEIFFCPWRIIVWGEVPAALIVSAFCCQIARFRRLIAVHYRISHMASV